MQVTLYNNLSDPRKMNKDIEEISTVNCKLLEPTDMLNPSITLELTSSNMDANYLYIPDFGRYYYIIDMIIETKERIRFDCKVDVLMTYKDNISQTDFIVTRSSMKEVYNLYLNDPRMGSQQNKQIQQKIIETDEFTSNAQQSCYVLTAGAPEINVNT